MPKKSKRKNSLGNVLKSAKRIFTYLLVDHPFLTLALFIVILFVAVLPVLETWLYGRLFDSLIETASTNDLSSRGLYTNLGLVLLVMLAMNILSSANYTLSYSLRERLLFKARVMLAEKVARFDQEHFDNPKINDLKNKVRDYYRGSLFQFFTVFLNLVKDVITLLLTITVLLTISPLIVLISIVISIPRAIFNTREGKASYDIAEAYSERRRDSGRSSWYLTSEQSIREIRLFNIIDYLSKRFQKIEGSQINEWISNSNKFFFIRISSGVIQATGFGLIILLLTRYVSSGLISVGTLTFYISTSNRFRNTIGGLFGRLTRIYERGIYVNDYFELLDIKNNIKDGDKILGVLKEPPLIQFKDVWFKYPGTDDYILKDFNLTIEPGEHLAIVGENGAGKTTLIRLLMRIYDVDKGQILLDGTDLKEIKLDSWYKHVGTLFQEYNFYHFRVKTNIGVGNVENLGDIENIKDSAKQSGAHDFIKKYKNKYDQVLSKAFSGGINPSTGQKQRIALARAFFRDSKLLILDEPTSSIDAKGEYEIFERLFDFAQDKSVVIISHRFSTVRNATRIVVLDEGKITEEGSHEELIKIPDGRYKTAFDIQKKGYE